MGAASRGRVRGGGYNVPLQQDFVLGRLGEDLARQDDARTDVNLLEDGDVLACIRARVRVEERVSERENP